MAETNSESRMDRASAEFVIYMINALAGEYRRSSSEIYHILDKTGCIKEYLVPFYDVLHTMGVEALIEDISEYVEKRGSKLC
ncbi:DUF3791 domain-containing protein [Ruminococcus sp.]|uniref:DUF3791 domain-containing protein n=1 Tax=Ruminococcus sp. TaxID=41978 RepID=UPI001B799E9A|nr:DUF3791 domain-containing protein [Ruminococcus sp.]MBP5433659.1 DUF3791 domain-containing protein [Ruminococcus sp.]